MQTVQAERHANAPTIVIRASKHAYHNVPVSILLSPKDTKKLNETKSLVNAPIGLSSMDGKSEMHCQLTPDGDRMRLTFLLADLPQGTERKYRLTPFQVGPFLPHVDVRMAKEDVVMNVGAGEGTLFSRYNTHWPATNKPFFYPILTDKQQPLTREWPLETAPNETHDHPHHRGLWFTHGRVNGIDFWSEGKSTGKTVTTKIEDLVSGYVFGGFRAETEWRAPDEKLIATDTRAIQVYILPTGDRIMDFEIAIKPAGTPLVFGDTKEGMFGLRVPDAWAPAKKQGGHIESSTGKTEAAAWGQPADWVEYDGPVGTERYGVAMFDAPSNFRHPQTWHVRDYGLFAVNPFGLHDFGSGAKGAGDYTVPANGTLALHYRLYFHKGDAASAHVAAQYAGYADPPDAEIRF